MHPYGNACILNICSVEWLKAQKFCLVQFSSREDLSKSDSSFPRCVSSENWEQSQHPEPKDQWWPGLYGVYRQHNAIYLYLYTVQELNVFSECMEVFFLNCINFKLILLNAESGTLIGLIEILWLFLCQKKISKYVCFFLPTLHLFSFYMETQLQCMATVVITWFNLRFCVWLFRNSDAKCFFCLSVSREHFCSFPVFQISLNLRGL